MDERESYGELVDPWIENDEVFNHWIYLYDVFHARRLWHFECDQEHAPVWCFGVRGECRLAASVLDDGRYLVYEYDADEEHPFNDFEPMISWLDEVEAKYDRMSPLGQELLDHLASSDFESWEGESGGSASAEPD